MSPPVRPGIPDEDLPLPSAPWLSRPLPFFALVAFVVVGTLGLLLLFPALAPLPMLLMVALWVLWKVPLRYPALGLFALALWLDCYPERPYQGQWQGPLTFAGRLLYDKLNNFKAGIPLPLVDLLLFLLLGIMVWRLAHRQRLDKPTVPLPFPLVLTLGLSILTLLWVEVYGMARGGLWRVSQWQFHQLILLPLMVALFNFAVRGPEDYRLLGKLILVGCFIKAFSGAFFIVAIVRGRGLEGIEYATTHSDTVLYVTGLMVVISRWMEQPTWRHFRWMVLCVAVILMGMHYNDRRLAYVSFFMGLVAAFLLSPWHHVKLRAARLLIALAPLIPFYIAVGWQNPTGIFGPLKPFKSMMEGENLEEGQLDYRDIENIDLVATWDRRPVLGSGFGHAFEEVILLPDISKFFEDYAYHPHNSLLGICAYGGVVGLTGLWMYLVTTVFLAVRAYHRSHPPEQRAAMLTVVAVVAAYLNQCFGDMGSISWVGTFMMAMAATCAGKQAIVTRAWPDPRESVRRTAEGAGAVTT